MFVAISKLEGFIFFHSFSLNFMYIYIHTTNIYKIVLNHPELSCLSTPSSPLTPVSLTTPSSNSLPKDFPFPPPTSPAKPLMYTPCPPPRPLSAPAVSLSHFHSYKLSPSGNMGDLMTSFSHFVNLRLSVAIQIKTGPSPSYNGPFPS